MASTKQQLLVANAAALVGITLLFAVALSPGAADDNYRKRTLDEEVRRQRILDARANTVVGILQDYEYADPDSIPDLRGQLDDRRRFGDVTLPLYIAVFSPDSSVLFLSSDLRELFDRVDTVGRQLFHEIPLDSLGNPLFDADSAVRAFVRDTVFAAMNTFARLTPAVGYVTVRRAGQRMLLLAAGVPGSKAVSHIVVGTASPSLPTGLGMTGTVLVLFSTVLVLVSLYASYSIAAGAFRPVETMINEVEAISDGRSLHKRVAVDHSSAELARLAATLNAMVERLEASFTALRTFTADASHELNTPLAVLRADVERAMSATTSAEEQMVALEEALREIRRMSDLVDSLLTLARADEGRLDMLRDRVDLAALTKEVYETALLLGEDAGLTVKLTTLENATVLGDRGRLRQLFLNLVTNAIKYTPRGGRVELSLTERLDGVAFAVKDTGIGISQTDLAHVFERFWRADNSRSRASGTAGFGLGLPIGHWIAQAHDGTLTATSKMGKGSTFTVTLPREGGELRPESVHDAEEVPSKAGNEPIE